MEQSLHCSFHCVEQIRSAREQCRLAPHTEGSNANFAPHMDRVRLKHKLHNFSCYLFQYCLIVPENITIKLSQSCRTFSICHHLCMHVQSCSRCCVLVQLQFIQARRSHYAHGTVKGGQGGPTVTARVTCHDGTLFAQAGN